MSARDRLVTTALDLFRSEGFHATGIDRVLEVAGVAKQTLYNHFRSKDDLALACLRREDEEFRARFLGGLERDLPDPAERLVAFFERLTDKVTDERFPGCPFLGAAGEFSDLEHPLHRAVREYDQNLVAWFRTQAEGAGLRDPDALAGALLLLKDGVLSRQRKGGPAAAREACARAQELARGLVAAAR